MCEGTTRAFVGATIVAFMVATPVPSRAQSLAQRGTVAAVVPSADQTQELRLRDGSRLYGRVVTIDADHILFRTVAGAEVQVAHTEILSLEVAKGRLVDGEFWPADSHATRLFFGPTARSLRRGQASFGVYGLAVPTIKAGLTDRFSISGGTPLAVDGTLAWITPKVQLHTSERAAVAAGVIHLFVSGADDFGMAFVVTTLGPSDAAVTAGAGCAYAPVGDGGCSAVVMVGGELRLARRVKFISENYAWNGGRVLSGGVRFLAHRFSADVGILAIPAGEHEPITFPFVNLMWTF